MQHVFIIGCKGIPAAYGGFETFVEKLTENQISKEIKYHVACAVDEVPATCEFEHNGAHCFRIPWKRIGAARAVLYDVDALNWAIGYVKNNSIKHPIFYVLACRIGPWAAHFANRIHALGGVLYVNPDGHEWMRAKWPYPVRKYWKYSERLMVKAADLLICDSKTIERYIHNEYGKYDPKTTYIAYGADVTRSKLADDDPKWTGWLSEHGLKPFGYYLVVGRFVPENNYETMIREFMKSNTKRDFALVTKVDDKFLAKLEKRTHFKSDPRIKFVGTVYDQELLKKVRENAFAYLHGHEVGGTNPSLLEALASTRLNLLLDVGFNREVAGDVALYWSKLTSDLARLIGVVDSMKFEEVDVLGAEARKRISDAFSWEGIISGYEALFLNPTGAPSKTDLNVEHSSRLKEGAMDGTSFG